MPNFARMPLDWIDTVMVLVGLYGSVAVLMAVGITRTDMVAFPALGVALAGPILRRRYLGPPKPYREDRSRVVGVIAHVLIGTGALVLWLGGLLVYWRHEDREDWLPAALACGVALGGLVIGATLDWLQRDHPR
ncbi:hypothetical protein BH11MYX1_BH11MYX1_11070 [soil metagenome]